jgi:homoserine kinase
MNGEKLASGVKHADNIAPCIYGGVTLIRSIFPLDIIELTRTAIASYNDCSSANRSSYR